jgi:hypothetical protein
MLFQNSSRKSEKAKQKQPQNKTPKKMGGSFFKAFNRGMPFY